ncbi:hypothetical protein ZIOFF_000636 [Zingiber officinale]|uniref:Uncharacterized protein n=1 Tax=Zingiber officinale TaxID=94328 RepID=A0A8J5I4R4_ZINOF|nr:hypothetical protein ZIOFF_000636 [Zingiber officinale]
MVELLGAAQVKENRVFKCAFAVLGIMSSLLIYGILQASKKSLDPVAPMYKYCAVSISNILTTTCQYEVNNFYSVTLSSSFGLNQKPFYCLCLCVSSTSKIILGCFRP